MATDVKRAANNPFRSPLISPNPTGAGPSSSTEVSAPEPPQPVSQAQPETRRSDSATVTPAATGVPAHEDPSPPRRDRRSADDLAAELQSTLEDSTPVEPPPAYTPSANPYEGEATVEYGPRRPFQPAPPPPPLPHQFTGMSGMSGPLHPQYSGMPQGSPYITPQGTGMPMMSTPTGGWGAYPGQGLPSSTSLGHFGPPPRHPSLPANSHGPNAAASISPAPTGNRMSEFARDFYSTPSNRRPSSAHSNASSDGATGPEHFERVNPPAITTSSSAPSTSYAPPNGPPPTSASPTSPSSSYAPPSGPPPSRTSTDNPEDCKPTTTPTPGHPLLNKGRILIYPSGYECRKCLNTGYKSFDPTHPCRKCWEKHSKPYTGAIVYAPRSPQSQRPLPNLKPPHIGHQPQASSSANHLRPQSAYQSSPSPWLGYPGRVSSTPCLGFGPGSGGDYRPAPNVNFTRGLPPPGSVVVRPGDPRIGGRLCWRCDGSGKVSFLIFDVENCPVCGGVGRIFQ